MLALWNYASPAQTGSPRTVTVQLKGTNARQAFIARVDRDHGDFHSAYEKMGAPPYPTQIQIQALREAAELPVPEARQIQNGALTLTLPERGLAVIELK